MRVKIPGALAAVAAVVAFSAAPAFAGCPVGSEREHGGRDAV